MQKIAREFAEDNERETIESESRSRDYCNGVAGYKTNEARAYKDQSRDDGRYLSMGFIAKMHGWRGYEV